MKVWKLLRDTFLDTGIMRMGTETAGSSTTLFTDTSLSLTVDGLIGGTLYVLSDAGGAGAAPEGEFKVITDNSATTITTAAFSAANGIGDVFGYISKEFSTETLIPFVNMALNKCGDIGILDTSITTADNQTEYTLPTAVKEGRIRAVYLQTYDNDADDNRWFPITNWRIKTATAGNTALLITEQFASGYTLLIEYAGRHPVVTGASSEIHETIHPELAKAALKLVLANYRAEGAISSQDGFNQQFNKAQDEFDRAMRRYKIWLPDKRPRRLRIGPEVPSRESEPDKVVL